MLQSTHTYIASCLSLTLFDIHFMHIQNVYILLFIYGAHDNNVLCTTGMILHSPSIGMLCVQVVYSYSAQSLCVMCRVVVPCMLFCLNLWDLDHEC